MIPPQEKHVWNQHQFETAWAFAKGHKFGLDIMVLLETGITRSELLGLLFEDVDLAGRCLHIRNGLVQISDPHTGNAYLVHEGLKNAHRAGDIPLSTELTIELARKPRVIYVGKPTKKITPGFLFYSPRGLAYNPRNWYDRVFCSFMDELCSEYPQVPRLTTHELRHTRASLLAQNRTDLHAIANLLGHRNLDMLSKRYLRKDTDSLRAALDLI